MNLLIMIGGLALFLYGMHLMGEGLSGMSGGRLEHILGRLTDSPAKAVFMGAGVTAVIQSSSAATVMVVGLVDSGILQLEQAAGIIMGANIGTTITSWILALSGMEADMPLLQMLQPTYFSSVSGLMGVLLLLGKRSRKYKNAASVLVGFSVLIFGMDTMSGAVSPLASSPEFARAFAAFSHPLFGLLAGMAVTALLQSSSASVGILQALCAAGTVSYGAALPIIMGQNIGTCATAMLSAVGAGRNARRAALIHLYFNLIGTALFMLVFYAVHTIAPFAFLERPADGVGVAMIHSIFNIAATVVLLPFSRELVGLACITTGGNKKSADFGTLFFEGNLK